MVVAVVVVLAGLEPATSSLQGSNLGLCGVNAALYQLS